MTGLTSGTDEPTERYPYCSSREKLAVRTFASRFANNGQDYGRSRLSESRYCDDNKIKPQSMFHNNNYSVYGILTRREK
jgi:hypothetical protein